MNIVTVKNKFQVVIPQHVRDLVHVQVGDFLEAGVEDGKIMFTPIASLTSIWMKGLKIWKREQLTGLTPRSTPLWLR